VTRREERRPEAALFGATVRRLRNDRGLSQDALGDAADLSQRYVSELERGENSPTLTVILKLCDALDVPPAELLAGIWEGERRSRS
jgi:transcriptional regulator with XRE-family HTH domain